MIAQEAEPMSSAENVTVKDLDALTQELASRYEEKDKVEGELKEKNKEIMRLESKLSEALRSLERDDYSSPYGKASFIQDFSVKLPSDERKEELWGWMKERGIFERYATVHATAFKSLFKAERDAAIANGEDPVTFALPGTEPAQITERLKFKPAK